MSKGKRLIVTLMSSGMATAMSFIVSFFLTPFITNMLGTEAYGFVTLSKNFVSYILENQWNYIFTNFTSLFSLIIHAFILQLTFSADVSY